MSGQDLPNVRRVWKRHTAYERVGVDVLGADGLVAIDYLDPGQPSSGIHLHFTAREWDEIVLAVAARRQEILARLQRP
jgi:hypothetical protein